MTKINIAVIGLGWVATNRHIPIILRHPGLNLYGVVDKYPERIERLAGKFHWLETSVSSEGEMPWGNQVQAVLIATDPNNHYKLAKKMLLAGKHVLIEKPLTVSPEEGRDLQEISLHTGLSCCVVHNFQFARATLKLQKMIREDRLGKIQGIEAIQLSNPHRRLPVWYEQLPFGLFYDESPHMFYMLEALAQGKLSHVSSTMIRKAGQNTPLNLTSYYTAGNIPVRLSMNFAAALSEWHIMVMGSKGVGIIDLFRDILVILPNDGLHRAREILSSSGSFTATHLWGFFKSGILLARGKMFYGADIVWDRFIKGLTESQFAKEISTARGLRVVEMQHELMHKSTMVEMSENENPNDQ